MITRERKNVFFFEHRYSIGFFFYVVLYNYLIVSRLEPWKVTNITFSYHVVDYSLGFRSQLLPGAIFYGLFGEHATRTVATVYETGLILLFFAGVSILLERFLRQVEEQEKAAAFVLILFYLSGAFTFSIFTDELGMLDSYWLFFSLLFFWFLKKTGLRSLIPVLFVLSLLVHFSSVLNYLLLFSILLLYRISIEPKKKTKAGYLSVFVLSITLTAGLFMYFLLYHNKNMSISIDAFHQMMENRGSKYFIYYDYSLYNKYGSTDVVSPSVFSIASPVWRTINFVLEKCLFTMKSYEADPDGVAIRLSYVVLFLTPLMSFIYRQWYILFKCAKGNKLKRFCVLLMMAQFPFTAVIGCLFSPDIIRWFTHAFLISFTMFLYILYHEEIVRTEALKRIEKWRHNPAVWVYFLAYSLTHSWPYC